MTESGPFPAEEMGMDFEPLGEETSPEGGQPGGNRTFIILIVAMGGFMLLSLIAIALYVMVVRPRQVAARQTQVAQINAQNTQVVAALTQTAVAAAWTPTPSPTVPPTSTPVPTSTPSPTPVIVSQPPVSPSPTMDLNALGLTATAVALTQGAITPTPHATSLPTTGFADEVGLPGLLLAALVLVGVILLARRLRASGA